jgi:hypothetical protein
LVFPFFGFPLKNKRAAAKNQPRAHKMEGADDAMRGHMSAHSFATGPVMAEPFISPLGFTITARIVLRVDKGAILAPPRFPLADDDDGVHLLAQLGLTPF